MRAESIIRRGAATALAVLFASLLLASPAWAARCTHSATIQEYDGSRTVETTLRCKPGKLPSTGLVLAFMVGGGLLLAATGVATRASTTRRR